MIYQFKIRNPLSGLLRDVMACVMALYYDSYGRFCCANVMLSNVAASDDLRLPEKEIPTFEKRRSTEKDLLEPAVAMA